MTKFAGSAVGRTQIARSPQSNSFPRTTPHSRMDDSHRQTIPSRQPKAIEPEQIAVGKTPHEMRGIRRSSPRGARDPIGEAGTGAGRPAPRHRESRAGRRGGVIARRGGASGGRSAGERGKGIGGRTWQRGERGSVFISSRSFFLEREEWW
jgi:hypothetical protein